MKNVEFYVARSQRYTQARSHLRVPADFPVQLRSDKLRMFDRARDVSEAGIGVITSQPLSPMTLVSMRLEMPHSPEPIDVIGRVMWATADSMGIRFEQSEPRLVDSLVRMRADLDRI